MLCEVKHLIILHYLNILTFTKSALKCYVSITGTYQGKIAKNHKNHLVSENPMKMLRDPHSFPTKFLSDGVWYDKSLDALTRILIRSQYRSIAVLQYCSIAVRALQLHERSFRYHIFKFHARALFIIFIRTNYTIFQFHFSYHRYLFLGRRTSKETHCDRF